MPLYLVLVLLFLPPHLGLKVMGFEKPLSLSPFKFYHICLLVVLPHVPCYNNFMSYPEVVVLVPLYFTHKLKNVLSLCQNFLLKNDPLIMYN